MNLSRNLPRAPALAVLVLGGGCGGDPDPVATMIDISPTNSVLKDAPDTVRLTATVRDQNGEAMPWVPVWWSTSDSGFVVRLSIDGLVTAKEPGTVLVRASAETATAYAAVVVEPGPRAVLQKTYRVMRGDDWVDNTNWNTDEPLGMWHGVFTDTLGRNVTRLSLRENGLTGPIPPELGHLRSLTWLDLIGNRLTGSIPPELGSLRSLRFLLLSRNRLTGSIPPELGGLDSLGLLFLSSNDLTGSIPPELGGRSLCPHRRSLPEMAGSHQRRGWPEL